MNQINDAGVIIISAAEKGLGPLLYYIAMSFYPGGLTADRYNVSKDAQNIWNFYYKNRGDVNKKPFDDMDNPKTPDPNDDCVLHDKESPGTNPVDFSYTLSFIDTSGLINNHKKALENFGDKLEPFLIKKSDEFASIKYHGH